MAAAGRAGGFLDKGKMLLVDDIIELLKERSNGRLVRSRDWVRRYFAPAYRRKFGRDPFWYEQDTLEWLANVGREAESGQPPRRGRGK